MSGQWAAGRGQRGPFLLSGPQLIRHLRPQNQCCGLALTGPLGLGCLEIPPPGWALPMSEVLRVLPGLRGQHPDELGLVPWAVLGRARS